MLARLLCSKHSIQKIYYNNIFKNKITYWKIITIMKFQLQSLNKIMNNHGIKTNFIKKSISKPIINQLSTEHVMLNSKY